MATRNIAEELRREWQAWEEEKKRQGLHFPQPQHWNPQQEQLSETVTICAGCQHENPEGAKFCTACGVRLNTERAGAMTKNWHVGKILLLWAVDLMIGGMVLWGASRPVRQESLWGSSTKAASFPYAELGVWLVLSLPLVVLTWRWLTWRERQQGSENRQEDRRRTGLNLERGFRRITGLVSVSAFVMGTFVFIPHFQYRVDQWSHAGEPQPSGPLVVYIEQSDGSITSRTFPETFTETHIKEALDKIQTSFKVAEGKFAQNSEPRLVDNLPPCFHEDRVTYVYQPASDTTPSVLYSRKALLQAEAQGELPPAVESLLQMLRSICRFPWPVTHPDSFLLVLELCALLALCVAAPWGVFFFARWIVFGFKPD